MAKDNSSVAIQRRRERWREILGRWRAGGLSRARFCRRHGIAVWELAWWRKRMGIEGAVPDSSVVPVEVVEAPRAGEIELASRGGRIPRFRADVEAVKLAGIVAALEAPRPEDQAC